MPVKDLYYKKYLKYKNKYLNLRILIGGSPLVYSDEGLFLREIDFVKSIYSVTYNTEYSIYSFKSGNIKFIIAELNKEENKNIITVKLNNLFELYHAYIKSLPFFYRKIPFFPSHITRLIFDDNNLSEHGIIPVIINFIKKFERVSTLSFKSCMLTENSATYLQQELVKLPQIFTKIDLSDNDLSQETKDKFNEIIKN
jgi:hypothetical protein